MAGPPRGPQPPMPGMPPPAGGMPGGPPGGAAGMPAAGFPGAPGGMPPPNAGMAGYDAYAGQRLVEQFESLVLSAGPGAPEADGRTFPRPIGQERDGARAPQQPFDRSNCSADNMRPTVVGVPNSTALRLRWQLPLGIIVRPMADEAVGRGVPVIPLGSQGIVRCRRCRTYMNPFCTWVDGGRRFKCNVCAMLNEVPVEYFSTLDANGLRRDAAERPELSCGTVEWVAPQEYMVRPPMPPVYFFAIDVSVAAHSCGMVSVVADTIRACLDQLPGDERTQVGFLTYDSSLQFYNLKASLAAPQMLVVTELEEPFLPMPDDLLVNLKDSRPVIEALLDALPSTYSSSTSNDSAMGPALQAAFLVMSHVGGKLLLFQAGLPTIGVGKLKPSRDNLNLYNSDREPSLRNPEDPFFKRYAGEASSRQITLDVFLGTNGFADLASLASIPRYTCGQVYYYPGFHKLRDGPKLSAELSRNLTRPTAWEAVMRIRCSRGLKIGSFHGHFFNRSTDLLALPTCDPDKSFAVQIGHEETMVNGPVAYGPHHGAACVSELSELYRASDGAATACLLAKLGVEKSLMAKLEDTRQALVVKLSAALKEYRLLHGAHMRNPGALIYPSTLRYLPAYVLGLVKSTAFR
ncbi:Sec23/Sec24 trunk domain-containing protein, partial [Scenedesmus sp. NREL 46B-D3]